MLIGMALLLLVAWLLLAGFCAGAGTVLGSVAGCGAMTCIGIGGAEGLGVGSSLVWLMADAYGKNADGWSDHGNWRGECPMGIQNLELVKLLQKNGGIEFAIVPGPESLHGLMDCSCSLFP